MYMCVSRRRVTRRAPGPAHTRSVPTSSSASPRRGCRAAACSDGAAPPAPARRTPLPVQRELYRQVLRPAPRDPTRPYIYHYELYQDCHPIAIYQACSVPYRHPPTIYFSIFLILVRQLHRGIRLAFCIFISATMIPTSTFSWNETVFFRKLPCTLKFVYIWSDDLFLYLGEIMVLSSL